MPIARTERGCGHAIYTTTVEDGEWIAECAFCGEEVDRAATFQELMA